MSQVKELIISLFNPQNYHKSLVAQNNSNELFVAINQFRFSSLLIGGVVSSALELMMI